MGEVEEHEELPSSSPPKSKKTPKRGIIYLSSIPPNMNVSKVREVFGEFGTVGRVYLQLLDKVKPGEKKKRKVLRKFTEGWVEFERKSVAKKVARMLNNQQVSTRKKSKQYDVVWNIKYLSNFKWTHLNERLAYEKTVRRQKLRAEIQLAKKKSNYFSINLDKHKKNKTFVNTDLQGKKMDPEEITTGNSEERKEFLQALFN